MPPQWPLANVWCGVSCEDQPRADERITHLLRTPAAVRFISAEPLLSPIYLRRLPMDGGQPERFGYTAVGIYIDALGDISGHHDKLDWVIVGGESGPKFRACDVAWITAIVDQCRDASVPVFVKQDAHRLPGQQGRIPDEYFVHEFPH